MNTCPIHGIEFKYVEPGVSKKTGKPYKGFYTCPEFGCTQKPESAKETVVREYHDDMGSPTPIKTVLNDKPDWDAKERRMVRMNVLNRATDLIVGGFLEIEKLEATVDKLEAIIYKEVNHADSTD